MTLEMKVILSAGPVLGDLLMEIYEGSRLSNGSSYPGKTPQHLIGTITADGSATTQGHAIELAPLYPDVPIIWVKNVSGKTLLGETSGGAADGWFLKILPLKSQA